MTSSDGYGFVENPASQKQIDTNIALYTSLREKFHFGVSASAPCSTD